MNAVQEVQKFAVELIAAPFGGTGKGKEGQKNKSFDDELKKQKKLSENEYAEMEALMQKDIDKYNKKAGNI